MTKADCKAKYESACRERYVNRDYPLKQSLRLFERCWEYYDEIRKYVAFAVQHWDEHDNFVCVLCGAYHTEDKEPCRECCKSTYPHKARVSTEISSIAWNLANIIYNRGDGLVFQDFNEHEQKCYLKAGFATFVAVVREAIDAELEKAAT